MAITLDELLGRTAPQETETIDRFPTYESFQSRNSRQPQTETELAPRYNFEQQRPYTPPVSEEKVRQYEASRPYVAPRLNEYQNPDYGFYGISSADKTQDTDVYAQVPQYAYGQYEKHANRTGENSTKAMNLYEFTASDRDRLSESELMNKLSHNEQAVRPLFDRQSGSAEKVQRIEFASEASTKYAAVPVERDTFDTKKRARLNTKGKAILAAYIALIVLVAVLIIVNGGGINRGTAPTPSSNAVYRVESSNFIGNISHDTQINCLYDAIY